MATTTITGTATNYIVDSSNTTLTNLGTVGGTVGIDVLAGLSGDVLINVATIAVGGTGLGVRLSSASYLTNQSGGTISGYKAVIAYNQPSMVTNDGAILGALASVLGAGVQFINDGVLTNQTSASVSGYSGVVANAGGTVTNSGTILGNATASGARGIRLIDGGTVTNQTGGTIAGYVGILDQAGAATVTNAGMISGNNDAVLLAAGAANRVIIDPGAVFSGTVDGGNTIGAASVSTLDLAAGTGTGTLSGLGTQYVDFAAMTVDSGAYWTLAGTNSAAAGATLTDSGVLIDAGQFTNAARFTGNVAVAPGAVLDNTGTIGGGHNYGPFAYSYGVVQGLPGGAATVVNAGRIGDPSGAIYSVIFLPGGGSITNQSTGVVSEHGSPIAVETGGAYSTLINAGTITASSQAVLLDSINGNSLTNQTGGLIEGGEAVETGNNATVLNEGTIRSSYAGPLSEASGVMLSGGSLSNTDGYIQGYSGVFGPNWATVTNTGRISGTWNGVRLQFGGVVDNQDGGWIYGRYGVWLQDGGGQVTNEAGGQIHGGVSLDDGGSVTNAAGGQISGFRNGIAIYGTGAVAANQGTVTGGYGVVLGSGAYLTNSAGGLISGAPNGVVAKGAARIVNQGTVNASGSGVVLAAGAYLANSANGTISSATNGVLGLGAATIVNQSGISGDMAASLGRGVLLNAGGWVTNAASGTNAGYFGVDATAGAATVTNAGTILGTKGAVLLAAGAANRVVIDPGAVFSGTVDGGNTIGASVVSTLELASGSSAGTIGSLGTQYIDFARTMIDVGAAWTLTGSNSIASGATLTDNGTLTNSGQLAGRLALGVGALLDNTGTIGGTVPPAVAGPSSGTATVINAGRIGIDPNADGVYLPDGGSVTNQAGGTIAGYRAVRGLHAAMTVTNAGSIAGSTNGTRQAGVVFGANGSLTNQSAASISGFSGVSASAGGTVTNRGIILGSGGGPQAHGVYLAGGGYVDNQSGGTISGYRAVGAYKQPATVTNDGVIIGDTTGTIARGMGVRIAAGGKLTNQSDATVSGYTGVFADVGGTVLNAGTIIGMSDAVLLQAGTANRVVIYPGAVFSGTVDGGNTIGATAVSTLELASGTTAGTLSGLGTKYIHFEQITIDAGAAWTLSGTNAVGAGTLSNAVMLGAGGLLDNTGTLSGSGQAAVQGDASGAATVINAGLIDPATDGVYLPDGGVVTNSSGGTIIGSSFGVLVGGGAGTVSNYGTISGGLDGVHMNAGGTVANTLHALIYGMGGNGIQIENGAGSVANQGSITGAGSGVVFIGGGYLTNSSGATISGGSNGVFGDGAAITISNQGGLDGNTGALGGHGVLLTGGGLISNQSGGVISGYRAIVAYSAPVTLSNDGTILGNTTGTISTGMGVRMAAGGALTNQSGAMIAGFAGVFADAGGTVLNDGTILGATAASGGSGVRFAAGGMLTNQSGATISGVTGVYAAGGATVANGGAIVGMGDAVLLQAGAANRVAIYPDAVFTGTVDGGNTIGSPIVSTLELASGSSPGTLSSLGTQYIDFAQVTIDAGAAWTLTGTNAIARGATLTNSGTLTDSGTLTNAGQLSGDVSLNAGGLLDNTGTIIGSGQAAVQGEAGGGATLINSGLIDPAADGVYLAAGGVVTNVSGGTIIGTSYGVLAVNDAATVTNAGSILGSGVGGVYLNAGGSVANGQTADISSARIGIQIRGGAGSVANQGSVAGSFAGVELRGGGSVTNSASGSVYGGSFGMLTYDQVTVINQGYVGANTGTYVAGIGVDLLDGGQLVNAAGATIAGFWGVYSGSAATVTNAGTIAGTQYAVQLFAFGTGRLIVDPGAVFIGTVDGGNANRSTYVSTLELASGSSAGTLSGLGSHYVNFAQVTIDSGATWQMTGSNTLAAGASISNAGSLVLSDATLAVAGTLVNDGGIVLDPSTLTVGGLLGTGSMTIAAGGTLEVTGSIAATETIMFAGPGAYLHLGDPADAAGSVTGFGPGETIDLEGIAPGSVGYTGGELTFGSGGSFPLAITNGQTLQVGSSADGTNLTTLCFCVDTLILTPRGHVRVQDLAVGDLVLTQRGVARPIVWLGTGAVLATRGRRTAATPVIVRKGALADGVPFRDLRVTKGHSLLIGNVLIPVECLINQRSIEWDNRATEVTLYHIELATHDVLLANGAPAESYRDDGNRWLFRNANSGWGLPAQEPCAPVLTGGPIVDAAWRRLLQRSGPRPGVPLTDDPDLHLLVGGKRVDALACHGGAHIFPLPAEHGSVRVVSRSGAPAELGLASDPRVLGVALRQIALVQGPLFCVIEAADPALAHGFHGYEQDNGWRWTDGDAVLPDRLFDAFHGTMELLLQVGCTTHYPLLGAAAGRSAA